MPKSKAGQPDNISCVTGLTGYTVRPYVDGKEDAILHKLAKGSNDIGAKDIVPLTFPKIKPEDGVGMYMLSKLNENEPKLYPQWDVARDSLSLDLITAKRLERQAIKRLLDKRQLSIKKRESFNEQYKDLEQKEAVFQTSFKKFNKFVRENQEKRERAEKKIVEEKILQEKRNTDIINVKDNIVYLTDIKAQMDHKIKEYRMFDDYLQGVVRLSSSFKNINDIIVRYEALTEAKSFLGERQNSQLASLENARADMLKLLEDKNLVLIGLNNQLLELQGRYESAKCNSLLWETLVSKIQDVSIRTIEDLKSVRTTCWVMYRNMCARKEMEPKCGKNDIEGQLLFVKKTLAELMSVHNIAKKVHANEINSVRGEMGSKEGASNRGSQQHLSTGN
ncbi:hypothetical protein MML48_9g00001900 [Holotrichia oblita]|uniref:Uncharacterized protein n=1 Tax=Holotrichia oblita TaxID=644536 RepID=A0ACB9SHE6_HOLOL|nr:hypothetical protein MML48_9g00001900 [Holotrichia oblita]